MIADLYLSNKSPQKWQSIRAYVRQYQKANSNNTTMKLIISTNFIPFSHILKTCMNS